MTKSADQIDTEITELISKKIAADDADSGWAVAWATMRVLPVLKDIADGLQHINEAIAPDSKNSPSLAEELRSISGPLKALANMGEGKKMIARTVTLKELVLEEMSRQLAEEGRRCTRRCGAAKTANSQRSKGK